MQWDSEWCCPILAHLTKYAFSTAKMQKTAKIFLNKSFKYTSPRPSPYRYCTFLYLSVPTCRHYYVIVHNHTNYPSGPADEIMLSLPLAKSKSYLWQIVLKCIFHVTNIFIMWKRFPLIPNTRLFYDIRMYIHMSEWVSEWVSEWLRKWVSEWVSEWAGRMVK